MSIAGLTAVGLARVSRADHARDGYSIPEQQRAIRACVERLGLHLLEIAVDDGVTGRVLERPAVQRVTQLAESGAFQVLVLAKVDRAGRENLVIQTLLARFRDLGIKTVFVEGGSDDTKHGRLLINMLGGFAEFEWEEIRARMMAGREQKARTKRTMPCGGRVFGYRHVSRAEAQVIPELAGRDGELLVIEEEAQWVREAFRRYVSGTGMREIAGWLNANGIRTMRGNPWRQGAVRRMLQNPAYMGVRYYGTHQHRNTKELTPGGKPRTRRTQAPREEWIELPCPAIVDAATWHAAQERMESAAAEVRGRPSSTWLLRGCVFCGVCRTVRGVPRACVGERQTNNTASRLYHRRHYRCSSHAAIDKQFCGCRYHAGRLEAMAWKALVRAVDPGTLGALARERADEHARSLAGSELEQVRLRRELADLKAQEHRIADLALHGISGDVIREKLDVLHTRRAAVLQQLQESEVLLARVTDPHAAQRRAEELATRVREQLEAARDDAALLQSLYRLLIRIHLYPRTAPPHVEVILPPGIADGTWDK